MKKFCTTLGNVLADLFGLILIIALIVVGVVCALVVYLLALLYKYGEIILVIWGIHLVWHYVIN